jgi:hypothetical protein
MAVGRNPTLKILVPNAGKPQQAEIDVSAKKAL